MAFALSCSQSLPEVRTQCSWICKLSVYQGEANPNTAIFRDTRSLAVLRTFVSRSKKAAGCDKLQVQEISEDEFLQRQAIASATQTKKEEAKREGRQDESLSAAPVVQDYYSDDLDVEMLDDADDEDEARVPDTPVPVPDPVPDPDQEINEEIDEENYKESDEPIDLQLNTKQSTGLALDAEVQTEVGMRKMERVLMNLVELNWLQGERQRLAYENERLVRKNKALQTRLETEHTEHRRDTMDDPEVVKLCRDMNSLKVENGC